MANRINGPLAGIKILDIGSALSTPMAATILGDQGADAPDSSSDDDGN